MIGFRQIHSVDSPDYFIHEKDFGKYVFTAMNPQRYGRIRANAPPGEVENKKGKK